MPGRSIGRWAGSSLGRRLFLLFLLTSVLPLGVSDWLATTAVTEVADGLDARLDDQTTRQVSRQVHDRLLLARTLLISLPAEPPAARRTLGAYALPGVGNVFKNLTAVGADGRVQWSSDGRTDSADGWRLADGGPPVPVMTSDSTSTAAGSEATARDVAMQLRSSSVPVGPARLWLGRLDQGTVRWVAELASDHLWAPVRLAGEDGAWDVRESGGRSLFTLRADDYPADWPAPGDGPGPAEAAETRSDLFLGGDFKKDSWSFVQRSPRPVVRWNGQPLSLLLLLVATATLLAIAWLSTWQIRRTLVPLEQLTEGTRQLAAGAVGTRVTIERDDELGTLAGSFNHMAVRIESQFDALAALTAIDRDILAGAPFERLAERVLRRLDALPDRVSARVSWREGDHKLHLAWLDEVRSGAAGAPQLSTRIVSLDAVQSAAYELLAGDASGPTASRIGALSQPWLADPSAAHGSWQATLPLRLEDRTRALLALHRLDAAPPVDLQAALDLRDRLSVALAARAREDELVHRAAHDSLTGLANRYGLHQQLDAMLASEVNLAVLFIDLDHFKDVNDSRGHGAGDELLRQASARLMACAPATALVARQGGDEFAVVMPGVDAACAEAFAAAAVEMLAKPFRLEHGDHVLGASIGIALSPAHGRSSEELLRRADVSLYAAKAAGRGRHRLFTPELDLIARDRVHLLAELRLALDRSEFIVHYQPRVSPGDGAIRSAEALVRWQHPERGLVFPGGFIEAAESCDLIGEIGMAVLEATCAQLAVWRRTGLAIDRVSVNVSPQQLIVGDLPAKVRAALDRHGLPATALELEVTESLLVGDARSACDQLQLLRDWGVTIALDDFGTGYSSMSTLRKLPIDVMKIDRAFVTDLCTDNGAVAVASAIVALARSMKLHLVAEGVETEAQAQVLNRMGCDELQGFPYSRAVPPAQFEKLPGLGRHHAPQNAFRSELAHT